MLKNVQTKIKQKKKTLKTVRHRVPLSSTGYSQNKVYFPLLFTAKTRLVKPFDDFFLPVNKRLPGIQ